MSEHFGVDDVDGEQWKEYRAIREEADILGTRSMVKLAEGSPRDAGVLAILSVSARLEAVMYLISKAKVF
ncbi:MAG: hypothetical protein IH921_10985 [Gemmatimonadetes bacterium]|nr:hypothetical protein [Gemmatimonadota bacterium]